MKFKKCFSKSLLASKILIEDFTFNSKLIENNVYFLMRLSSKSFKTIIKADKQDQLIEIKYNKKLYTARVVRFFLESGVEEILITNLFEESLKIQDFKELYFTKDGA